MLHRVQCRCPKPTSHASLCLVGALHSELCLLAVQLDGHTVVRPSAAAAGYSSSLCTVQSKTAGGVYLREDRPALVVSSTSWTPDEDFQVLLDAAVEYDEQVMPCLAPVSSQGSMR